MYAAHSASVILRHNSSLFLPIQSNYAQYPLLFLDDPHVPYSSDITPAVRDYLIESWRADFCSVAAQLRKRIKSHQSKFVELSPPTPE